MENSCNCLFIRMLCDVITCYTWLRRRKWLGVRGLCDCVCWFLGLINFGLRGW